MSRSIKEVNHDLEITCCVHATLDTYYVTELRGYDRWEMVAACPYFDVFSSTIIGWGLYGTRCIEFLFGSRSNMPFMVLYSLTAIVGATMNLGLMWSIAETFNGLMVIPNLIAVFLLSGVVVKMTKEYFAKENG